MAWIGHFLISPYPWDVAYLFSETKQKSDYVYHPINAFHMLQRMTNFLPKLDSLLDLKLPEFKLDDLSLVQGPANGLADLQEFHNIPLQDLMQGRIPDPCSGRIFQANSGLTFQEALQIANAAKEAGKVFLKVWCFIKSKVCHFFVLLFVLYWNNFGPFLVILR